MLYKSSDNTVPKRPVGKLPYVMLMAVAYLMWWQWISGFPLALTSDDALNFSRGVERFSVLEFRPHFPGYPTFILLSRLAAVWVESALAPVWVSLLSAAAIPLLVARLVYLLARSWLAATLGCLLVLMQPLLASVALSGLSDSAAIMLLLLALVAAMQQKSWQQKSRQQKSWMVGVWIGLMLATRPSYFPLALGMLMIPVCGSYTGTKLAAYLKASTAIAVIGALSLVFVWFHDGAAYFDEGVRFTQGHFSIWGNTAEGDSSSLWQWLLALANSVGWLGLGAVFFSLLGAMVALTAEQLKVPDIAGKVRHCSAELHRQEVCRQELAVIAAIALLYWLWITAGQNPDNLRHWAPVLILFLVVFPVQLVGLVQRAETGSLRLQAANVLGSGSLVYCLVLGYPSIHGAPLQAPIQQAIAWIRANPQVKVVGTNYSVNLLRDQLAGYGIYDMYYPSSRLALINADKQAPRSAWRLSGTPIEQQRLVARFEPRFTGERRLFLYQISQ